VSTTKTNRKGNQERIAAESDNALEGLQIGIEMPQRRCLRVHNK